MSNKREHDFILSDPNKTKPFTLKWWNMWYIWTSETIYTMTFYKERLGHNTDYAINHLKEIKEYAKERINRYEQ